MSKPALGKGLGALIPGANRPVPSATTVAAEALPGERVVEIPIHDIQPNRYQPRRTFQEAEIEELAATIKAHGLLQPIVVRKEGERFELISGERRLRACKSLALPKVRAIVREATNEQLAELAIIENIQRAELNPIEEAEAYARLIEVFNLRQEDVATKVGKSRTAVANSLRLLNLDPQLKELLSSGDLSAGHAKVILGLDDHKKQRLAAERVILNDLSVRQTEELVSQLKNPAGKSKSPAPQPRTHDSASNAVAQIESVLRQKLGTKVRVSNQNGKGTIMIDYFSNDDLSRILESMGISF